MSYLVGVCGIRYRTRLGASTSSRITHKKNEGGFFWDLLLDLDFFRILGRIPSGKMIAWFFSMSEICYKQ
jgi:hypothetical protein